MFYDKEKINELRIEALESKRVADKALLEVIQHQKRIFDLGSTPGLLNALDTCEKHAMKLFKKAIEARKKYIVENGGFI